MSSAISCGARRARRGAQGGERAAQRVIPSEAPRRNVRSARPQVVVPSLQKPSSQRKVVGRPGVLRIVVGRSCGARGGQTHRTLRRCS